jgi:fumarylacetoacetate (FAA) hydrolase
MKLTSLPQGRDGRLIIVSNDLAWYADADHIVPTLRDLLDSWDRNAPVLESLAIELEHGAIPRKRFHEREAAAPLPRTFAAFTGAVRTSSDDLRGGRDPLTLSGNGQPAEIEIGLVAVTGDVPQAFPPPMRWRGSGWLGWLMISCCAGRGRAGTGGAPFSPVFVTPDGLGEAWQGGRLHLPLSVERGAEPVERLASDAVSDLGAQIAHLATTRRLCAGTLVATAPLGVVPVAVGETRIEARDAKGRAVFGAIEQQVVRFSPRRPSTSWDLGPLRENLQQFGPASRGPSLCWDDAVCGRLLAVDEVVADRTGRRPRITMNSVGRMNRISGTVMIAGRRAAFSSARIMRSWRNSADSTRSADASGVP